MTARRFTDKADLDPSAVSGLPVGHPALRENRTLFPTTVVEVTEDFADRLLVSGENNRKLGKTVAKGAFKGYALYGLSLEERATCPTDCAVREFCYGNGMQMARRHRIGDTELFFTFLEDEIRELLEQNDGLLIRLHVLGDFPSVEYVAFWSDMLAEHEKLACYGYTHRRTTNWNGDEIGDAIEALKDQYPDRFRIRWSTEVSRRDSAMVIDYVPNRPRLDDGIVCPAQTDATACCASCGLCWEPSAKSETILFIKHGQKSYAAAASAAMASITTPTPKPVPQKPKVETRPIQALELPSNLKPNDIAEGQPLTREVSPKDLLVEPSYQRDLSGASIKLIRKIVVGWDWAKFKPPVCAETEDGLFIIDGQHTAIAAASHPLVKTIPVLVVSAERLEKRAEAFVSHNRDRLAMSAHQIFHAERAAGNVSAQIVWELAKKTGAIIPRSIPRRGNARAGEVLAIQQCLQIYKAHGDDVLERIFRIAVGAELAPLGNTVARGLRILLTDDVFAEARKMPDSLIANVLKGQADIEADSRTAAVETECGRDWCCASIIFDIAMEQSVGRAAA